MKKREIIQALNDAGFTKLRNGKKHEIWVHPNGERIPISHGSNQRSPHLEKWFKVRVRKAKGGNV